MSNISDTELQNKRSQAADILSVSDLKRRISSYIEQSAGLHDVRCICEVTGLHQSSTVLYFTLTDGDAELPSMFWANRYQDMDAEREDIPQRNCVPAAARGFNK